MPRAPRFSYAQAVHHITLRCNNREFLFSAPSFELYLQVLQEARAKFSLSLYNFCLMTNHVHLLFQVNKEDVLSKAMHWVSSTFVRKFNKATGRNGHLWEGRFRSTIIEQETSFFRCMAYVDLNPVRAGMVATPQEYRWSAHDSLRREDTKQLDLHPLYLETGPDAATRHSNYVEVLAQEAQRAPLSLAREYFMGSARFVRRMVKKFSLDAQGTRMRWRDLGSGVVCTGPKHGAPKVVS